LEGPAKQDMTVTRYRFAFLPMVGMVAAGRCRNMAKPNSLQRGVIY
jgi:hypothetical protein